MSMDRRSENSEDTISLSKMGLKSGQDVKAVHVDSNSSGYNVQGTRFIRTTRRIGTGNKIAGKSSVGHENINNSFL